MPRFFLPASDISGETVLIRGDDARHISRSLRMKPGECIVICDMRQTEYECKLEDVSQDIVTARIISSKDSDTEPPYIIKLYQALPKSDKLDLIIQKAVETGASEIIPFESNRCVVRIDDAAREAKRLERRRRIAHEAAKQCGRGSVPGVRMPLNFDSMLEDASHCGMKLFFYEGDGTVSLRALLAERFSGREVPGDIAVVIGAEGGFTLGEVEKARNAGFELCGLGKRILRCETASGFVLACLSFWFEL